MAAKPKLKVWRFQRTPLAGTIVSAMTRDRRQALHFKIDPYWEMNFGKRFTFYATAQVVGTLEKPRLRVVEERTEEDW